LSDETILLLEKFKADKLEVPIVISKNRYTGAVVCSQNDIFYNSQEIYTELVSQNPIAASEAGPKDNIETLSKGGEADNAEFSSHCAYGETHDKYEEYKRIAILDDGFSALNIQKNLNIILIDATREIFDQNLIPAGILREPLSAIKYCDCLVITKSAGKNLKLELNIKKFNKSCPIFYSYYLPATLKGGLNGNEIIPINNLKGKKAIIISAIGNPEYFYKNIKECEIVIVKTFEFSDHYLYNEEDLLTIKNITDKYDILITTLKDYVKLREFKSKYPDALNKLYYLDFELKIDNSFYEYILASYLHYIEGKSPDILPFIKKSLI
jgi:hypothetical protein